MYTIDVEALKWGIGIYVFTIIVWLIMAKRLLRSEPKARKVNLADRYDDIKELDSFGIKPIEFKQMVYDNFIKIDNAFMNYDYETLKKYLTKDLYDYYISRLEIFKEKKYRNILEDFELINVKIYNVTNEHDMLMVSVYLNVKMYDYIINIDTGKYIKGNKDKIDYEFELTFLKRGNKFLLCKKSCINDMLVDEKKDK